MAALRKAMEREGLTWGKLALRAGLALKGLYVESCRGFPCWRTRLRLERALDYRYSLWTDAATLAHRRRCMRELGIDPVLVSRPELIRLAARMNFNFSGCRTKADYVRAVFERASGCRQQRARILTETNK